MKHLSYQRDPIPSQDHILVDNEGTARLATAGRSSIVTVPEGDFETDAYINKYRYSAPEIWSVGACITKESDVYGIGMVAYEASYHYPVSSGSNLMSVTRF